MSTIQEIGLVIGLLVAGLAIAFLKVVFGKRNKAALKLSLATRVPIAAAKEGELVKLQGRVRAVADGQRASRVDGRPLIGAHLSLRYAHVSEGSRGPIELDECGEFILVDESGEALICASEAKLLLNAGETVTYSRPDLPAWLGEIWANNNVRMAASPGRQLDDRDEFSIDEGALVPDHFVAVLGRARWEVEPREGRRPRLVIEPDPEVGLLIGDDETQIDR